MSRDSGNGNLTPRGNANRLQAATLKDSCRLAGLAEAEKQLKVSGFVFFVSHGKESPTPSFLRFAPETRRWRGRLLDF
ncbi:hypothetical protein [Methanimicrococcus hongohii]|uniref:hypothetical protein n=1 Tax=Methanimicrococcus hongohii TaxID=3028295 RepID=UPI00292ED0FC|nr:hypothetical protein [Methanimicrococcus sp. Hf6]